MTCPGRSAPRSRAPGARAIAPRNDAIEPSSSSAVASLAEPASGEQASSGGAATAAKTNRFPACGTCPCGGPNFLRHNRPEPVLPLSRDARGRETQSPHRRRA
ncbi:Hypothetical protein A7982_04379 [Minicystis rosea]|nr:Hypothetical protein A7982_04379 [Minicystis rosea]